MALSIRNSKTEKLAREVSELSGEGITQAITHALEDRLQRLRGQKQSANLVEDLMAISRRCQMLPVLDARSAEEIMGFNEIGLPEHGD